MLWFARFLKLPNLGFNHFSLWLPDQMALLKMYSFVILRFSLQVKRQWQPAQNTQKAARKTE